MELSRKYFGWTLVALSVIVFIHQLTPRQMTSLELAFEQRGIEDLNPRHAQRRLNSSSVLRPKAESIQYSSVDITLVTMYLNLGKFRKGDSNHHYDQNTYLNWLGTWAWLNNTVVAFFDDKDIYEYFKKLRSHLPSERSKIYLITRCDLPAFADMDKVIEIFAQRDYPKHYPNTVKPAYSLAMNAKYDVVKKVLDSDDLKTNHIAWLDIGAFRAETGKNKTYKLEVPPDFNNKTVSYSRISSRNAFKDNTPFHIIKNNKVWVGGAFFLATKDVMRRHVAAYHSAVRDLLSQNLASTDQQVLASLYFGNLNTKPTVEVTENGWHSNPWFAMAYKCRDAAAEREKKRNSK